MKIDALFCELIERILLAGYAPKAKKGEIVTLASTKLDALKFFLHLAWELKALDHKKYARLAEDVVEIGRMLGGWMKSLTVVQQ